VSRRSLATAAAIALALAALWWARSRELPRGSGSAAPAALTTSASNVGRSRTGASSASSVAEKDQPQAVVWRMVDASRARDVSGYLDCFAGDLRTRLDATVRELGEDGFADYLGQRVAELKGVALYDVERAGTGAGAAVTVEYVFATEKEMQRLHLQEQRNGWRITAADASRREKSLIPYGTPIEQVE
jgi:hypothetical protein